MENSRKLHESNFPSFSRAEFILSKLSIFSAHVSGVIDSEVGGLEALLDYGRGQRTRRRADPMLAQ